PLVGGNGDHEGRAIGGDPPELDQRAVVVLDVLEHVAGEKKVELAALERQRLQPTEPNAVQPTPMTEGDGVGGGIHAGGGTESPELDEVPSCTAAGIEHPCLLRELNLLHEGPDDRPL